MIVLLMPSVARSWWEVGHMLTAKVAQIKLQASNPAVYDKANLLVTALANFTDGRSNTFAQSAVWPDDLKEKMFTALNNFHFSDRVFDPTGMQTIMPQYDKDISSINLVNNAKNVLAHSNATSFERCFMVRYLLHLVGDIHQPLHSVALYNKSFPKGDMGGNLLNIVTYDGLKLNLHSFMDSIAAVVQKPNQTLPRPLDEAGQKYILGLATRIIADYPESSFGNLTQLSDPNDWAFQAYKRAVNEVYPYVATTNQASYEWTNKMYELCRSQIALGGYRLAATLAAVLQK